MSEQRRGRSESRSTYGRHGPWSSSQLGVVLVALATVCGLAVAGWIWVLVTLWTYLRSISPRS